MFGKKGIDAGAGQVRLNEEFNFREQTCHAVVTEGGKDAANYEGFSAAAGCSSSTVMGSIGHQS
jgi:hypothetical protein